jgi:NAD-dependent deacetylase
MQGTYREIAEKLAACRRVLFITGAGVSADSGLPTYRGVGGLYNSGDTEEGMPIEEAISGRCLARHPEITWKYLSQIQHNCDAVQPNAAHRILVELEKSLEVVVLTQNIDGLHLRAGSSDVIEIHGTLETRRCTRCDHPAPASTPDEDIPAGKLPRCEKCGGVVRPNVVLFGEMLPEKALYRLQDAIDAGFGMVFVIGTTAVFPYISQPVLMAIHRGIPTVEINPARTHLSSHVAYYIPRGAAEAMTGIMEAYSKLKKME